MVYLSLISPTYCLYQFIFFEITFDKFNKYIHTISICNLIKFKSCELKHRKFQCSKVILWFENQPSFLKLSILCLFLEKEVITFDSRAKNLIRSLNMNTNLS